ncbi:hypothetical protein DFH28DRAFT_1078748 [Melampsora americana]|nr:hypothetical protein DFH28DRAFT_1078748 [Melampsora americana]
MEDLQSNLLSSTIDTLPNQTSHRAHTTPHPSNPHAQLTSNSDHEHHHITSHLSSINLTDQPAVIQHDGPVKRISKHTAIRGKKLNDTLPTHFESSSANRSSTSKTTASSSSHRIETGLMPSNQKPLEIDAGHVRAIRNDNRSSQDLNRLRTRMESNGSIMLHQQPNQGSLGHVSHLSRARADQQVGNRPLGASIEQSRNIASTSINLRNRRKNVTQKSSACFSCTHLA